ncbi:hypothetical protein VTI74DRAFT_3572 [Chaetomium olivicolor]
MRLLLVAMTARWVWPGPLMYLKLISPADTERDPSPLVNSPPVSLKPPLPPHNQTTQPRNFPCITIAKLLFQESELWKLSDIVITDLLRVPNTESSQQEATQFASCSLFHRGARVAAEPWTQGTGSQLSASPTWTGCWGQFGVPHNGSGAEPSSSCEHGPPLLASDSPFSILSPPTDHHCEFQLHHHH